MKIAVTGKGGVGKTTIAATLCHVYAAEGKRVLAVDADPDANLASALGADKSELAKLRPIAELSDLIEERTGAKPGAPGGIFRLNPRVDDIPEGFGIKVGERITLLVMGRSKEAASGCYCPENVLLKRLLRHMIVERDEVVVVDMEAGIEHLTRGTSESVDAFIVVVEPGQRSIQTAHTVRDMARTLGVKHVYVIANKVRSEAEVQFIKGAIVDMDLVATLPYDPLVIEADIKGAAPSAFSPALVEAIRAVKDKIEAQSPSA